MFGVSEPITLKKDANKREFAVVESGQVDPYHVNCLRVVINPLNQHRTYFRTRDGMADIAVLEAAAERRGGSNPLEPTNFFINNI